MTRSSQRGAQSSFYFVREANGRALVVSILGKFISQKSFKRVSTISQNNSNNDSDQENRRQPNFIPPCSEVIMRQDGKKEVKLETYLKSQLTRLQVKQKLQNLLQREKYSNERKSQ